MTSPGYEVNDLGFQSRADRIRAEAEIRYVDNQPGRVFRFWDFDVRPELIWNYGGDLLERGISFGGFGELLNYWGGRVNDSHDFSGLDARLTRGGPLARRPGSDRFSFDVFSDRRKPWTISVEAGFDRDDAGGSEREFGIELGLKPASSWSIELGPRYSKDHSAAQYLDTIEDPTATGGTVRGEQRAQCLLARHTRPRRTAPTPRRPPSDPRRQFVIIASFVRTLDFNSFVAAARQKLHRSPPPVRKAGRKSRPRIRRKPVSRSRRVEPRFRDYPGRTSSEMALADQDRPERGTMMANDTTATNGSRTASQWIIEEVTSWPGVKASQGVRGELAFTIGRHEIGHLHGDHAAHFSFPRRIGAELREQGRVGPHPVAPQSVAWAARTIESVADVQDVIELLRINYDRVVARYYPPDARSTRVHDDANRLDE